MLNDKRRRGNWLNVVFVTLIYDLFIQTIFKEHIWREQWLNKRLTALGKIRRNKVLKIWIPIKYIFLGLFVAVVIINVSSSDFVTTTLILIDIVIVTLIIWANR